MLDITCLDPVFRMCELSMMLTKPLSVNRVRMSMRFEDVERYGDETVLMGIVGMFIETDGNSFMLDMSGVTELYKDSETKREAVENIILQTKDLLTEDLEEGRYEGLWDRIDLEAEDWRIKERE